jgi:hypothetical protein
MKACPKWLICRRKSDARDRPCTRVTRQNLHGKEGVDGSSPSEGSSERPANEVFRRLYGQRAHAGRYETGTASTQTRVETGCFRRYRRAWRLSPARPCSLFERCWSRVLYGSGLRLPVSSSSQRASRNASPGPNAIPAALTSADCRCGVGIERTGGPVGTNPRGRASLRPQVPPGTERRRVVAL